MVQLADLFSLPEMCLMCQVTDLFIQRNIDFQPAVLFSDVRVRSGGISVDPNPRRNWKEGLW